LITSRLGTAENSIDVPISSAEDILLAKLDGYRVFNLVSERQRDEVLRLLKLNRKKLNWPYLESIAQEIGLFARLQRLRNP
jgi:hypothetical protein